MYVTACSLTEDATNEVKSNSDLKECYGEHILICEFKSSYELRAGIELLVDSVSKTSDHASVSCAEISYGGEEENIKNEVDTRGNYICLFNSAYTMNSSLNRMSTFIEDFKIVDKDPSYSEQSWAEQQIEDTQKVII